MLRLLVGDDYLHGCHNCEVGSKRVVQFRSDNNGNYRQYCVNCLLRAVDLIQQNVEAELHENSGAEEGRDSDGGRQ